ncbi:ANTAR domain-containing protein [Nakamurella endophytica]|uniref:ANTAR domain-containing protein n=1 Tax=Nakamurella endophytica TaxID=1748367 RepID=A0A917T3I2_9ACTN|nr:GAF and ANTAR domain-containing protein [Nakamurella endophytica]GGM09618.1 hypothetical protein GCM10011594_31890 [Nakamurella endophytica]
MPFNDSNSTLVPDQASTAAMLATLQQVAAGLALGEPTSTLCQGAVKELRDPLGIDLLLHYGVTGQQLQLRATVGIDLQHLPALQTMPIGHAVCGAVAQAGAPLWFQDVQHDQDPRLDLARSLGVTAYFSAPLLHQAATVGTVSFGSRTRTAFTSTERGVLSSIADLLAVQAAGPEPAAVPAAEVTALQQRIAHLEVGLERRTVIGRATGMLMLALGTDPDAAWSTLRYLSMNTNRRVRDVAELIEQHLSTAAPLPDDLAGHLRSLLTWTTRKDR